MTEKDSILIKRFDGSNINFRVWKIRVQTAMMANNCENAIDVDFDIDEENHEAENALMNKKAKQIIIQSITDSICGEISEDALTDLAKDMWAIIIAKYHILNIQGINFKRGSFAIKTR